VDSVTCLGVQVGPRVSVRSIWDTLISSLNDTLALWSRRSLSLMGKITVIKSLATSKLWYVAAVLALPDDVQQHINSLVWRFLWNGKPRGVLSRSLCLSPRHEGGLGMLDVASMIHALHVAVLVHVLDDSDGKFKDFILHELRSSHQAAAWGLDLRILTSAFNAKRTASLSPFWRGAISVLQQLNLAHDEPRTVEQVLRHSPYYNDLVTVNGSVISDKPMLSLARAGITTIGHLFDDNLQPRSAEDLGIPPRQEAVLARLRRAIPETWIAILDSGYNPPAIHEWFVLTRNSPPDIIMRVTAIRNDQVEMECFIPRPDCSFALNPNHHTSIPLLNFPGYRARVLPNFSGWLLHGLEEELDIDATALTLKQLSQHQSVSVRLLDTTVSGTRGALTDLIAKPSTAKALWPNVDPNLNWRRVWTWIWASFRDRKVSDFI
jgi:hypothetical protein